MTVMHTESFSELPIQASIVLFYVHHGGGKQLIVDNKLILMHSIQYAEMYLNVHEL